jgi:hypothetical protein
MLSEQHAANPQYIEELWEILHHVEREEKAVTFLTSYYDDSYDSGSVDPSAIAVLGGPVMSKERLEAFDKAWTPLLESYRIFGPLHMADFVRPHGQHIGMYKEMKLSLFAKLVELINQHKLFSVSISLPQTDFMELIPEQARKELIGPYAFAFFCAVMLNQGFAARISDKETSMAYLVDDGCAGKDQLVAAHSILLKRERSLGKHRHTGTMGFDTDERISALQAADVIAWCARKRQLDGALTEEFAPLNEVLADKPTRPKSGWVGIHQHIHLPKDAIELWARPLDNWIRKEGHVPTLEEFLTWDQ